MPSSGGISQTQTSDSGILEKGNTMTADFIVALITCVVTVINTVVAVLSYLKNK